MNRVGLGHVEWPPSHRHWSSTIWPPCLSFFRPIDYDLLRNWQRWVVPTELTRVTTAQEQPRSNQQFDDWLSHDRDLTSPCASWTDLWLIGWLKRRKPGAKPGMIGALNPTKRPTLPATIACRCRTAAIATTAMVKDCSRQVSTDVQAHPRV